MDDVLASTEYARITAFAIDDLLRSGSLNGASDGTRDPFAESLASLAIRLQQFRQHSDQLGTWLRHAESSASPDIRRKVADLARECRKVSAIVFNEVNQLVNGGGVAVDRDVLVEYNGVLAAYSRVFVFFTQILSIEGEKDSKLNHPDYHQLVANAQAAAEKVILSKGSLLDSNDSNLPAVKASV